MELQSKFNGNLSETWQNPSFYKSSKFRSFPSRSSAVTQVLPSSIDTSTRTIPGNAGIILMFVRMMCQISESSSIRHESSSSCGFGPLWASASNHYQKIIQRHAKIQNQKNVFKKMSFYTHSAPLPPPLHAKPLTCQGQIAEYGVIWYDHS